ncbi:siphovirus Gp157 family protein [Sporosarcina sp. FSL K6-1508]|uniref:siphovirus Gp157 family protein n=1 Tax=Sporosarcina sp. FSL K6-1508 TaxID=2921553 RepID=UPI0030F598A1
MATLYDLTGSYAQIQQMIEEGADDLSGILETVEGAIEEKLEGYAMVIRNIESDVEGLKGEEKRLADRRKTMENGIKRMKENMQFAMSSTGNQKIKGEKFTFTVQKNPPALKVLDESLIPNRYFTESKPVLDKKSVLEYLKEHGNMPGAQIQQGESLRIR